MIRVVAAIIPLQGHLLICQRPRGSPFAFKWEFPGGKMRRGETPWEALTRELREELGVEARIGREVYRVRHRYPDMEKPLELSFFLVTLLTPNQLAVHDRSNQTFRLARSRAFESIRWVPIADLRRFDFLAGDRALVMRLVRGEFLTHACK